MVSKPSGPLSKILLVVLCLLLLPLVAIALPIGYATGIFSEFKTGRDRRSFLAKWAPRRTMLVYSNSPVWRDYIEAHWLPRLGSDVVVLNWSERSRWDQEFPLESRLFRSYLGSKEFNPAAIVFHRKAPSTPWQSLREGRYLDALLLVRRDVTTIRFWQAFRDYKHGRESSLTSKEAELFNLIAAENDAV